MKYGLKRVTMDDVARELGISKKTLYVRFKDKKHLVQATIEHYITNHQDCIEATLAEGGNAIDRWFRIARVVTQDMNEMKPTIYFDLRRYYPQAFQVFEQFRNREILSTIKQNLIRGKEEGLYREDLDVEVVSRLYVNIIPLTMNPEVFPSSQYPFIQVYFEVFRYHVRGIASKKGLAYLEDNYKNPEDLSSTIA